MNLKDKVLFLGLGNYGCKQAKIFAEKGYEAIFANGSEQDLKILGNMPNIYRLKNFDGFGGHRERALDCLVENEEFMSAIQNINKKIIFIPYGGGGSTGSGCSTVCSEILLEATDENGSTEKIVCPIPALPSSNEAIAKHRNAYQAIQELQELEGLGATFFINNNVNGDYDYINTTFAKMLDNFLTNDSYGQINNFDESERIEMLHEPGAMVFSLFGKQDQGMMLDKLTRNGIFAPIQSDKICGNIGIIHAGQDNSDIKVDSIISEVGKPLNVFEGYNGRSTMIAASGLNYPINHLTKIGELAQRAAEERQRSRKTSVQKLGDLNLIEEESQRNTTQVQKKPSKLEMLRKKQSMIGNAR